MRVTGYDAAATGAVGAAVGLYWAYRAGVELPLVSGPRVLSVVVFGLGVAACVAGGSALPRRDGVPELSPWMRVFGLHGLAAFVLTVIVLVTGSTGTLAALVALVVALWLVATVRHLLLPAAAGRPAERARARG